MRPRHFQTDFSIILENFLVCNLPVDEFVDNFSKRYFSLLEIFISKNCVFSYILEFAYIRL